MIGKITVAGIVPSGYTPAVVKKERVREIKTLSVSDCLLRSAARHNKPAAKPQWLRRISNAYERGDVGISRQCTAAVPQVFRYNVVGRLAGKLPNR